VNPFFQAIFVTVHGSEVYKFWVQEFEPLIRELYPALAGLDQHDIKC
jgi:hypothetical protein